MQTDILSDLLEFIVGSSLTLEIQPLPSPILLTCKATNSCAVQPLAEPVHEDQCLGKNGRAALEYRRMATNV